MLTKEECEKALDEMWFGKLNGYPVLKQLINEHFVESSLSQVESSFTRENSNPPLKFKDLKEDMWVFDTYDDKYKKIYKLEDLETISFYYNEDFVFYENNRFYDREVKEE